MTRMAAFIAYELTTGLLYGLVSIVILTTGKLLEAPTQSIYPYSLGYKAGEFQGDLCAGVPEDTIVAVKGTLGDHKYHQRNLGVEVRPVPHHQKWVNPFYRSKTSSEDKNRTEIPNQLKFVIMGSSKFKIDKYGDILVQESAETYGLYSVIYFCVVLVRKNDDRIVSNPLSFIVEIISISHPVRSNKNALTAGILVLLIVFLGVLTISAISCRRWRFPEVKEDPSVSGSVKDDDVVDTDWKDHYHIKVEDLILEKDADSQKGDSTNGSPRRHPPFVRSDSCVSTLSWLRLNFENDSDHVDSSSNKSLAVIQEGDGNTCRPTPFQIVTDRDSHFHSTDSLYHNGCPHQKSYSYRNQKPNGDRIQKTYTDQTQKPNGDLNQKPNGDLNQKPNGDRNQKPNDDRNQKPNGDRNLKPNGDQNQKPNGDRNQKPNGDRNQKPNGDPNQMFNSVICAPSIIGTNRSSHYRDTFHNNSYPEQKSNSDSKQKSNSDSKQKSNNDSNRKSYIDPNQKPNRDSNQKSNSDTFVRSKRATDLVDSSSHYKCMLNKNCNQKLETDTDCHYSEASNVSGLANSTSERRKSLYKTGYPNQKDLTNSTPHLTDSEHSNDSPSKSILKKSVKHSHRSHAGRKHSHRQYPIDI